MTPTAYMPIAACAMPGRAGHLGRLSEAAGEQTPSVHAGQFVYGERPVAGAKAGAAAARRGAGCLVDAAEGQCPPSASLVAKAYETDPGPSP